SWPTHPGVKLVERSEERLAGDDIHVNARALIVPILVTKCGLGAVLSGDAILYFSQLHPQRRVARHRLSEIERASFALLRLPVAVEDDSRHHRHYTEHAEQNAEVRLRHM